jgi:hypothetical protein
MSDSRNPSGRATMLAPHEKAICSLLNLSEEEFAAQKSRRALGRNRLKFSGACAFGASFNFAQGPSDNKNSGG